MAYGNDLGHWGEDIAVEYMTGNGWYLRHRNWCYDGIEIDQVYIDALYRYVWQPVGGC